MTAKVIIMILSFTLFLGCNFQQKNIPGKDGIIISTDKNELAKLITLQEFNPRSAEFVYASKGKHSERDPVPGPTDYRLEAVLYFKSTDNAHRKGCAPFEESQFSRDDFNFSWLADDVREELLKTDAGTKGYVASCFYKGVLMHGSYFYLKNKILLVLFTN